MSLLLAAASCGKKETLPAPEVQINHAVPSWAIGKWLPIRIIGDPGPEDMMMTVTADRVEYYYPGCVVGGRLIMDKGTPIFAANFYRLIIENANCPREWDFPTYPGQEDYGKIWGLEENGEMYMFRASDKFADPFWVYIKMLIK